MDLFSGVGETVIKTPATSPYFGTSASSKSVEEDVTWQLLGWVRLLVKGS